MAIDKVKRFKQVASVFAKYKYAQLVKRIEGKKPIKPVMLRKAFEDLGGGFIKLGQLLSLRTDLIPKEYSKEFAKLQDKVRPFSTEEAYKIIEKECGQKLTDVFLDIEKKPFASASIAQVYNATLKSGKPVVVKVQRPNVAERIREDIDILHYIGKIIDRHTKPGLINIKQIADEVEEYTKHELNFEEEAKNIETFRKYNKKDVHIIVPKVYKATKKVLVLEKIDGTLIKKIKNDPDLANILVHSIFKQVFYDGFFHGDPHPGNIIVSGNKIAFIDFGIMGSFKKDMKRKMFSLFRALVNADPEKIAQIVIDVSATKAVNYEKIVEEIEEFCGIYDERLKNINFGDLYHNVFDVARRHGLQMPSEYILLAKTTVTIESVTEGLDPNFHFIEGAKPFIEDIFVKKLNPKYILKRIEENVYLYKEFIENLPHETFRLVGTIKQSEETLEKIDTDMHNFTRELDRSSNRVAYGLILTGVIVAAAILMDQTEYTIAGISAFSFVGFSIAAAMGLMIFVSILKEKY